MSSVMDALEKARKAKDFERPSHWGKVERPVRNGYFFAILAVFCVLGMAGAIFYFIQNKTINALKDDLHHTSTVYEQQVLEVQQDAERQKDEDQKKIDVLSSKIAALERIRESVEFDNVKKDMRNKRFYDRLLQNLRQKRSLHRALRKLRRAHPDSAGV